jgi:hypothetical protein
MEEVPPSACLHHTWPTHREPRGYESAFSPRCQYPGAPGPHAVAPGAHRVIASTLQEGSVAFW